MLISPTEPAPFHSLGKVTMKPEEYGSDFFWFGYGGKKVGVQRKEVKDLLSSVQDGRLWKQISQMQQLDFRLLIIEGKISWTNDGKLMMGKSGGYGRDWTLPMWQGVLWSVQAQGIWSSFSSGVSDTIRLLECFVAWTKKEKHGSLAVREGPGRGIFGTGLTEREWAVYLMQGLPNVGRERAERIYEELGGGIVGLKEGVGVKELMKVKGVGKKTAEQIVKVLS